MFPRKMIIGQRSVILWIIEIGRENKSLVPENEYHGSCSFLPLPPLASSQTFAICNSADLRVNQVSSAVKVCTGAVEESVPQLIKLNYRPWSVRKQREREKNLPFVVLHLLGYFQRYLSCYQDFEEVFWSQFRCDKERNARFCNFFSTNAKIVLKEFFGNRSCFV